MLRSLRRRRPSQLVSPKEKKTRMKRGDEREELKDLRVGRLEEKI